MTNSCILIHGPNPWNKGCITSRGTKSTTISACCATAVLPHQRPLEQCFQPFSEGWKFPQLLQLLYLGNTFAHTVSAVAGFSAMNSPLSQADGSHSHDGSLAVDGTVPGRAVLPYSSGVRGRSLSIDQKVDLENPNFTLANKWKQRGDHGHHQNKTGKMDHWSDLILLHFPELQKLEGKTLTRRKQRQKHSCT